MNIIFRLRFCSRFGQQLYLLGDHELLGGGRVEHAIPLRCLSPESWEAHLELPDSTLPRLRYHYVLQEPAGTLTHDWGDRPIFVTGQPNRLLIVDSWNFAGFYENAFYTEPFQEVLLAGNWTSVPEVVPAVVTHTFKVRTPLLQKGQTLCLLGNSTALGKWNTSEPLLMWRKGVDEFFTTHANLSGSAFPLEYKYGVFDVARNRFVRYEDGPNRLIPSPDSIAGSTLLNDGFAVLPPPAWRGVGVAIPVFSLRSERSLGIGEFADLKLLADWAQKVGLQLIQILPVNDTTAYHTWKDSYPYAAISAFALHPIYLRLDDMLTAGDDALKADLESLRKQLNRPGPVDYEPVARGKMKFLRRLFPHRRDSTFATSEYQVFFAENSDWLVPYSAFCHFRDVFGTPDYRRWPEHQTFDLAEIERQSVADTTLRENMDLCFFLQFHLHQQLREVVAYAHRRGVILKGDIAIGVARHGVDTWQHPHLFHMDRQAGAPPDAFAAKGQNWGFPTYNWKRMEADGFAWWRRRFQQMGRYFDAFRIDHILGFFRIWSIPLNAVEGILGQFVQALPLQAAEMEQRGVTLDMERLTQPWITDSVLAKFFGDEAETVRKDYLEADTEGHYRLKSGLKTQGEIAVHLAAAGGTEEARLREGLFDLVSNVVMLQDTKSGAAGGSYHFRFGMEDTLSFQNLDPVMQSPLRALYLDYFFRRQNGFWMMEGLSRLPALKRATKMLVCGEDLGMVPACVPEAMRQLGLVSLEVQRMPKRMGVRFFRPWEAPYLSVVTPSTHDMSTIRGWWREDPEVTQVFFREELGLAGDPPPDCEGWINRLIVQQHLDSPAIWSVFQLQDLMGMDEGLRWPNAAEERINIPADPGHYWRYRMHLTLEELIRAEKFNRMLAEMTGKRTTRNAGGSGLSTAV